MTIIELANILTEMYDGAQTGEAVAMIHLFGIKYATEINQSPYSKKDIIEQAGLSSSYVTELTKGVKLANYVYLK